MLLGIEDVRTLSGGHIVGMQDSTLESHQALRPSQIADVRLAASKMTGPTRRAFQAEMALREHTGGEMVRHRQVLPDHFGIAVRLEPQQGATAPVIGRDEDAALRIDRRRGIDVERGFPVVAPQGLAVLGGNADGPLPREVEELWPAVEVNKDRRGPADPVVQGLPEDAAVLAAPPLGDFRERFYCDRVSMPNAPQDMGNSHSVGRSYCGHARPDAGIP